MTSSHTDQDPRTTPAPAANAAADATQAPADSAAYGTAAHQAPGATASGAGEAPVDQGTTPAGAGDVGAAAGTAPATADGGPAGGDLAASGGTDGVPDRGAASLPEPPAPKADVASIDDVEEAMRDVVDPELGINVVDLGLVYDIRVDEQNTALLDMTLTSAACPLTDVIEDQARSALVTGPAGGIVEDVKINWVWMPPWGPEKITEDGREQLRALGFTV